MTAQIQPGRIAPPPTAPATQQLIAAVIRDLQDTLSPRDWSILLDSLYSPSHVVARRYDIAPSRVTQILGEHRALYYQLLGLREQITASVQQEACADMAAELRDWARERRETKRRPQSITDAGKLARTVQTLSNTARSIPPVSNDVQAGPLLPALEVSARTLLDTGTDTGTGAPDEQDTPQDTGDGT